MKASWQNGKLGCRTCGSREAVLEPQIINHEHALTCPSLREQHQKYVPGRIWTTPRGLFTTNRSASSDTKGKQLIREKNIYAIIRQKLAGFEQKQPVGVKLPPSLPIPDESCLPDRYDVLRLGMAVSSLNESIVTTVQRLPRWQPL